MSFIIRKVRRRPNGQELTRDESVDQNKLTIGRATDCDIYLPDLRVSLNHAEISIEKSNFRVIAVGERPVKAQGKFGNRFQFSQKDSVEVEIGPYLLTIYRDADSSALIVAVEQVEEKSVSIDPKDEQRIFTLKKTVPGKRSTAWFFSIIALIAVVIAPIFYFYTDRDADIADPVEVRNDEALIGVRSDQFWLSGGMSLAHTSLSDNCNACHTKAFQSVQDETCLECHEETRNHALDDELRISKPELARGEQILREVAEFAGKPEMRCASCHIEHNGRDGIVMSGEALCVDCHRDMTTRLTDTDLIDVTRFEMGDHPNFKVSIVKEPHRTNPVLHRVSLDDNPISKNGLKFPHDIHLEAGGGVANDVLERPEMYDGRQTMECEDCHQVDAGGALFLPVQMEMHCSTCHSLAYDEDPQTGVVRTLRHGEPKDVIASMRDFYYSNALQSIQEGGVSAERRRPGSAAQIREDRRREEAIGKAEARSNDMIRAIFSEGGACFDCHAIVKPDDPENVDQFDIAAPSVEDAYMPKAIFDHKSHDIGSLDCVDCHEAESSASSSDVLMPGIDNCLDCHRNENAVNFIPSTCIMCHDYHDDDHIPFMTPTKTRHASIWPASVAESGRAIIEAVAQSLD